MFKVQSLKHFKPFESSSALLQPRPHTTPYCKPLTVKATYTYTQSNSGDSTSEQSESTAAAPTGRNIEDQFAEQRREEIPGFAGWCFGEGFRG